MSEHKTYLDHAKNTLARIGKRGSPRRVEFEMRWARWAAGKNLSYAELTGALDRAAEELDKNESASIAALIEAATGESRWAGVNRFIENHPE